MFGPTQAPPPTHQALTTASRLSVYPESHLYCNMVPSLNVVWPGGPSWWALNTSAGGPHSDVSVKDKMYCS